ncbi:MAG: hypothetical protein KDB14_23060 [Planctomycetales bacterium]|nr:hypothetical protein [Planctomycetales bacterium]
MSKSTIYLIVGLWSSLAWEASFSTAQDSPTSRGHAAKEKVEVNDAKRPRAIPSVKVAFENASLEDVANRFQQIGKVPVRLDHNSLRNQAVSLDTRVTFSIEHVSWPSALRHVLRSVHLTSSTTSEGIRIHFPVDEKELPRVYPVVDLTHRTRDSANADYDTLNELLVSHVRPDLWPEGTGPGPIHVFSRSLLFNATDQLDADVRKLLTAFRKANQSASTAPVFAEPLEQRIWDLLERPSDIAFGDMEANAALRQLVKELQTAFLIDPLTREKFAMQPPLRFTLRPAATLETALDRMLRPHGLRFNVVDEAILLATRDSVDAHTIVWPIFDIIHSAEELSDFEQAVNYALNAGDDRLLTVNCAMLPVKPYLVVSGTWQHQRRVSELLKKLRAARAEELQQLESLKASDD